MARALALRTAVVSVTVVIAACAGPTASAPVTTTPPAASSAPAAALPPLPPPNAEPCDDAAPAIADDKAEASDGDPSADGDAANDGFEPPALSGDPTSTPFDSLSDAELRAKLDANAASLGTMSLGGIHSGALAFGVQMPPGKNWILQSPAHAWGTRETVDALTRSIDKVAAQFADTPPLYIGDIGAKNGGFLPPHVSHQGGRDVDIGYYYSTTPRWYAIANAQNLDRARTWALVKTMLVEHDVEMLLIDTRVQKLLKEFALESGEDKAWLDDVFQVGGKSTRPMIFHVPGHASHIHARFYAPVSRELGRRAYPWLLAHHMIKPPTWYVDHVVKHGETLGFLAAKYRTSIDSIKRANRMTTNLLAKGRVLKIPRVGGVERAQAKLVVPPRKLPPPKAMAKSGDDAERERDAKSKGNPCGRAARDTVPQRAASLQQRTPVE